MRFKRHGATTDPELVAELVLFLLSWRAPSRTQLKCLHWAVLGLVAAMLMVGYVEARAGVHGGDSSVVGLGMCIALTAILWIPGLFLTSVIALSLELRHVLRERIPLYTLFANPACYVLGLDLFVLLSLFEA